MIELREAKKDDLESIKTIEDECFATPWTSSMLMSEIENEDSYFIVYVNHDKIIGYALIKFILEEACIENIAVAINERGKTVGTQLVAKLIEKCVEKKTKKVYLEVRSGNSAAISLYKKYDFRELYIRENYYKNPVEDAVIMTLDFEVKNANTRN